MSAKRTGLVAALLLAITQLVVRGAEHRGVPQGVAPLTFPGDTIGTADGKNIAQKLSVYDL
jgi:hypothetical protein